MYGVWLSIRDAISRVPTLNNVLQVLDTPISAFIRQDCRLWRGIAEKGTKLPKEGLDRFESQGSR